MLRSVSLRRIDLSQQHSMTMYWQTWDHPELLFSTLAFFLFSGLFGTAAVAQDNAVTSEDLTQLFPETLGTATLQSVTPQSGILAAGLYTDLSDLPTELTAVTVDRMEVAPGEPVLIAGGTVVVNSDGSFTLTDPSEAGRFTIQYPVDEDGRTTASVAVAVQGGGPTAVGVDFETSVGESLSVEAPGLLAPALLEDHTTQFRLAIGLGAAVESAVQELSSMQMMGATAASDWETETWPIQGQTMHYMHLQGNSIAFALVDQFMISMMAEDFEDADAMRGLLEELDFHQFEEWEAPGTYAAHSLSPDICLTIDCFADRVATCESGQMGGQLGRRLGGIYTVEEATDDGACLMSFMFTANPNDDLVDAKVFFAVEKDADVHGNFQEDIMGPMQTCMEDESSSSHCGGPLLDMMQ